MNAIFTYLTWTAKLREAKKTKLALPDIWTRFLELYCLSTYPLVERCSHVNTVTLQARLASE